MDKEKVKQDVCAAIRAQREEIIRLAESIAREPEMGFKEQQTAAKIAAVLDRHHIPYTMGHAITGVKATLAGRSTRRTVAVLGELDAVSCFEHPLANRVTGAAHACGHHAQIAAMIGCGLGLTATGAMQQLDGNVRLFAVPAEEYVEIEYRNSLIKQGKIKYLGGKAELIRLGEFDDVDMAMMIHLAISNNGRRTAKVGGTSNGFIGKLIRYTGREAHAAGAPHEGINALNAAMIALMAVHAQRETFRDDDCVRFHPIITKGGDLVNVIPAEVRMESYVRAKTVAAMMDANKKIDRALKAGAMAVGAEVAIQDLPGYLPLMNDEIMTRLYSENITTLLGPDAVQPLGHSSGSTDMGDLAHIMPVIHPWVGGAAGIAHARDFRIVDPEMAYIITAKSLAMTVIDLLWDHAAAAEQVLTSFQPRMTKAEYLHFMDSIGKTE